MPYNVELKPMSKKMKNVSPLYVTLVLLLTSYSLTGCVSKSTAPTVTQRLYQPPVLRLPAGQPVQTVDGVYLPPLQEIWHSDARFREVEQANLNLSAALAQERNRK